MNGGSFGLVPGTSQSAVGPLFAMRGLPPAGQTTAAAMGWNTDRPLSYRKAWVADIIPGEAKDA